MLISQNTPLKLLLLIRGTAAQPFLGACVSVYIICRKRLTLTLFNKQYTMHTLFLCGHFELNMVRHQ